MESPNAIRDVRISLRFVSLINERIQESQGQFKLAFKRETQGKPYTFVAARRREMEKRKGHAI